MRKAAKKYVAVFLAITAVFSGLPMPFVQAVEKKPRAEYFFQAEDVEDGIIEDKSGNNFHAELKGKGASVKNGMLTLPGGAAGSDAAYISIPKEVFVGQNTLTINVWLKNQTGSGNYSAMYFGTKTKYVDSNVTAGSPLNYWILNPAQPDGYFKSVWTDGNDTDAPFKTETAVSGTKTGSGWAMYTTVITPDSIRGYYNGEEVCNNSKTKTTVDFGTDLAAYIGRSAYNDKFYKGGVYGVEIYSEEFSQGEIQEIYDKDRPSELVTDIFNKIKTDLEKNLGDISEITENLELPVQGEEGATITWKSENPNVVDLDGTVTRPQDKNVNVKLEAVIKLWGKTETVEFPLTVISTNRQSQLELQLKHLTVGGSVLEQNLELPGRLDEYTTVVWESSNPAALRIEASGDKVIGVVTRPGKKEKDTSVVLKAEVVYKDGGKTLKASKDFTVTVRAEDYGQLIAYTNSRETASLGNSLHLAYSEDGKNYMSLNSNTGICFAKNIGGAKNTNPNILQDMHIFRKADGSYGMIARNGANQKYVYVFSSSDLVHFTNEQKFDLGNSVKKILGIEEYEYNGTTLTYALYWTDGNKNYRTLTKDFAIAIEQNETQYTAKTIDTTNIISPEGAEITDIFGVDKEEYQYVVNKLGVVKNTGMQKVTVTAKAGDNLQKILPEKVTANYSDGSTADFGVTWNEKELKAVDLSKIGESFTVTGTVKQKLQYENPFIEQRADPCILKGNDGYYYFTASYPVRGNGDKEGYDRIVLRRSETIEGLAQAEEKTIWHYKDTTDEFRYIWAPEIRLVNGKYYVFYTSSIKDGANFSIRPHVLKCTNPDDIMNKESWQTMGLMQNVSSETLAFSEFSLDMTVFENHGRWYIIWAQADDGSCLFLAEINPEEPWKCISNATKISLPEFSWERQAENVNEGPSVIKHDGKIYVAFSASGTGPEYCVGLLYIDENENLLDKDAWVKQPYPVLTSSDVPGEYGPGHNSFTVDEEGNPIFVYHARGQKCYENQCEWANSSSLNDPCRDARLKRVHWAADGAPILKMSYEEELAQENCTVQAVISIKAPDKEEDKEEDKKENIKVQSVNISKKKINVGVKDEFTLKATVKPSNATDGKVIWKSSNPQKASVTQKGVVKGKKKGTVTITATAGDKVARCKVTVKNAPKKITLNAKNKTLKKGKTFQIKVKKKTPKNSVSNKMTYKTSNRKVATVSKTGKIKGIKPGRAKITVISCNKKAKAIIKIKVVGLSN